MTFEFDSDTAVERVGDGLFRARITDRWNTFAGPNGGYVLATAIRALIETSSMPHPLAVSGHFLRPPRPGEAEIRTEPIRAGRRHASASARLAQEGKDILAVVATTADLTQAGGRDLAVEEAPELPSPEQLVDPMSTLDPSVIPAIGRRMDYRMGSLPGFAQGNPSGQPEYTVRFRFADGRPPDPLALVYLGDALPPTVLELGELVSSTVEMTVYVRAMPADGWMTTRVRTRYLTSGYHEEDADIWDSTGQLVAQSRQLALLGS